MLDMDKGDWGDLRAFLRCLDGALREDVHIIRGSEQDPEVMPNLISAHFSDVFSPIVFQLRGQHWHLPQKVHCSTTPFLPSYHVWVHLTAETFSGPRLSLWDSFISEEIYYSRILRSCGEACELGIEGELGLGGPQNVLQEYITCCQFPVWRPGAQSPKGRMVPSVSFLGHPDLSQAPLQGSYGERFPSWKIFRLRVSLRLPFPLHTHLAELSWAVSQLLP